jgi:hypothetical protein
MTERKPLALSDEQLTALMQTTAQLHAVDRDPFLNALAALFGGRSEIGDGEFNRGLRMLLRDGHFQ